jgi:hypothetical protein
MSYLVLCIFDLKDARREDYSYAFMDLGTIGLRRAIKSDAVPTFHLPATAVVGMVAGTTVEEVRTTVGKQVQGLFKARGLTADFFLVVCGDWACAGESM